MQPKPKYYVVWKGRKTGIYSSWSECALQVNGFQGARYKAFSSRSEAEQAFRGKASAHIGKRPSTQKWMIAPNPPINDSWCVDAACSGSPGPLEFRGVDLNTGKEMFREGPFQSGTNNVGEFLAIVQALMLLGRKNRFIPIYSDSSTAIGWVRKMHCNTQLKRDRKNANLFNRIEQAEIWLKSHKPSNSILKWDTKAWGEIPADFGRK
jgi:ribonuclease HI